MLPMWKLPRKGSNRKVMTNRRVKTKQQMKIRLLSMHGVSSNTVKKKQPDQLDAINALGTDGIVMNFTGFDLNSLLQDEEKTAAETERQGAFFNLLAEWKVAHADKELIFKGSPQNVIDKERLVESRYIIVNAHKCKKSLRNVLSRTDGFRVRMYRPTASYGSHHSIHQ